MLSPVYSDLMLVYVNVGFAHRLKVQEFQQIDGFVLFSPDSRPAIIMSQQKPIFVAGGTFLPLLKYPIVLTEL